jgi:dTDP-4-dehydrorhamnose 3,5-epimerase
VRFTPVAELPGLILVEPTVYEDERGFFLESYHSRKFAEGGISEVFVQDNHSRSVHGVLRGLHFQHPDAQGKLVRVTRGEVFDVAVDIRVGSPTFGRWYGVVLSAENRRQLYIPPGFAHGFLVTGDEADFLYKCTVHYRREHDRVLAWNDPALAIPWPIAEPLLSPKDASAPTLAELEAAGVLPRYDRAGFGHPARVPG